jgi:hypothetical protein
VVNMSWGCILRNFNNSGRYLACNLQVLGCGKYELGMFFLVNLISSGRYFTCNLKVLVCGRYELGVYF